MDQDHGRFTNVESGALLLVDLASYTFLIWEEKRREAALGKSLFCLSRTVAIDITPTKNPSFPGSCDRIMVYNMGRSTTRDQTPEENGRVGEGIRARKTPGKEGR